VKRFVLGVAGLTGVWLWSRGARDPREWPQRLPQEISLLWDDLDDAFAAGRRAAARQNADFEEDLRRARSEGTE
jgi:hypothetical protein